MNARRWPLVRRFQDLRLLIFFVTTQCNARCDTCFYWKELNTMSGLSLEQIERLASSMPAFRTLLISGGEPSLRLDLPQIVGIFRKHNRIREASIPTNGLLPERIETLARQTLQESPGIYLSFNISIDGFAETHDKIRGVPGNFERAQETIGRLEAVRDEFPRFSVVANTVICPENYDQVVPFAQYVWRTLSLDGHFFEIIRGEPKDMSVAGVPADALADIYHSVVDIQARYIRQARSKENAAARTLGEILDVGRLLWQYGHQYRRYANEQLWTVPCLAGKTVGVVEPGGVLKACELRGDVANLSDSNWDFAAQWYGSDMAAEIQQISVDRCDCTHACFVQSSRDHSLRATYWEALKLWWRYRQGQEWL